MDPNISSHLETKPNNNKLHENCTYNFAALKIQSFFKLIYIRKLLSYQQPTQKKFFEIYDALKGIYSNIFSVTMRTNCRNILRNVLLNYSDKINPEMYIFYEDILSVLSIKIFNGMIRGQCNSWMMISRHVLHLIGNDSLIIKISLFTKLDYHVVRVFNNDTEEEIISFTNEICTHLYDKNSKGYTIVCYTWTNLKTVPCPWSLYFVTLKRGDSSVSIMEELLHEKIMVGCYVPNIYDNICKFIVNFRNNGFVTLRISSSFNASHVQLICEDESGSIVWKISGVEHVILPLCMLINDVETHSGTTNGSRTSIKKQSFSKASLNKQRKLSSTKNSSTISSEKNLYLNKIFVIKAMVLDNSWPLTVNEWITVRQKEMNPLIYSSDLTINSSRKSR